MKITYIEKGIERDYKRIDTTKTFFAISFFNPKNTSLLYFKLDPYNYKTIAIEDIIQVEF